jgi:hypothetical protein
LPALLCDGSHVFPATGRMFVFPVVDEVGVESVDAFEPEMMHALVG